MDNSVIKYVTCKGAKVGVIIDREVASLFDQYTWTGSDNGNGIIYVHRRTRKSEGGKPRKIYLHTFIANPPSDKVVDHINGDPLDNRKSNLRAVTRGQNNMNRGSNRTHRGKSTTSSYKGVSWDKRRSRWVSNIGHNYKRIYLGCFDLAEDAARAYDIKAQELHGEFAFQNFPRLNMNTLDS